MKLESGYESGIVREFMLAHGVLREDGRLRSLNELMLSSSQRETLERWWVLETVPTHKVDAFLMRHDLMLFELEHWAQAHHGRDGFVDAYPEPQELAA